jgi:dihydropteroate synthase
MTKHYLRPLGLCHGRDASALIASGNAGRLGGSSLIAFTQIEVIERAGANVQRRVVPYAELQGDSRLEAIEHQRPSLAGLSFERPRVMGVVNVTPDSFSDGGLYAADDLGIAHGTRLAAEGADVLDVGGESTRPGSDPVDPAEELARVRGVVRDLAKLGKPVSIDTRKASVMRNAAEEGASIINDVSALRHDLESLTAVQETGLPVILMHALGDPRTMQLNPRYEDVALDVYDFLEDRIAACRHAGIGLERIAIDPGIGFGKTFRHNLDLLHQLTLFHGLGVPVLVGLSRKGFIGAVTGEKLAINRVGGSVGGAVQAALSGAHILRAHDVKPTVHALAVAFAAVAPDTTEF